MAEEKNTVCKNSQVSYYFCRFFPTRTRFISLVSTLSCLFFLLREKKSFAESSFYEGSEYLEKNKKGAKMLKKEKKNPKIHDPIRTFSCSAAPIKYSLVGRKVFLQKFGVPRTC